MNLETLKQFLTDANLSKIVQNYQQNSQNKESVGFNAFVLASDSHYKENFHIDILQAILAPDSPHNEKNKFLYLFIDLLNKLNGGKEIDKANFQNAVVVREKERIDVLIYDEISKKAIIIENKMNNAVDMDRQLPRYFDDVCAKGFEVVAIVYLPLQAGKTPDEGTWKKSGEDKEKVMPLLKILPAYATNTPNLYEHWLLPCLQQAQDFDAICVLRQYAKLIKSLNINSLDMVSIEEFYKLLQENNGANWQNALAIQEMLEKIPLYLAERIKAKYEDKEKFSPFPKLWIHSKNKANASPVFFSTFKYLGYLIQLEIQCRDVKINLKNEAPYEIFFRDINNPPREIITDFSKKLSILETSKGKEYEISKKVGSEKEVFEIIDAILEDLRKLSALPTGG